MSIAKMLEYQKVDKELYTLQKDFYALQKNDKYLYVQNSRKDKLDSLPKLNKELDDIIIQLNELMKKVDILESKKIALESNVDNYVTLEEFLNHEKTIQSFEEELNAVSRDVSKLGKRMTDINFENKKLLEQIENLERQIVQFKQGMISKQKEMMIKAKPIADKLQKIAEDIDPNMMAKYMACRNHWKFPVFMPYTAEGNCSACGMFVKIEVDKHLVKEGDFTDCPHCRRILYKV